MVNLRRASQNFGKLEEGQGLVGGQQQQQGQEAAQH